MRTHEVTMKGLAWTRALEQFPADAPELAQRQKAAIESVLAAVMAEELTICSSDETARYRLSNRNITIAVPQV